MGTNKKNPRAKDPQTIHDPLFTEYDMQKERNIDQNAQKQGAKFSGVIPASSPYRKK